MAGPLLAINTMQIIWMRRFFSAQSVAKLKDDCRCGSGSSCVSLRPEELSDLVRKVEASLFDGIVLGDHVVFPEKIKSPYPYSKDGTVLWDPNTPWSDVWVAIAEAADALKGLSQGGCGGRLSW